MEKKYKKRQPSVLKTKPLDEKIGKRLFHTKISYVIVILAITVLLTISIRNWNVDTMWSRWALFQASFGIIGFFGLQFINGNPIIQKNFEKIELDTVLRTGIIFAMIAITMSIIPTLLTISALEQAMYFVFAAVCEEMFFRAMLLYPFLNVKTPSVKFVGVIFTSVLFALIHVNYWGQIGMLISVFVAGLIFGTGYLLFQDITANILAHFLWNVIQAGILYVPLIIIAGS